MPWILLSVALGAVGVAVLAALAVRVLVAVRELGRELQRSQERLEPKLAAFENAAERGGGARPEAGARSGHPEGAAKSNG